MTDSAEKYSAAAGKLTSKNKYRYHPFSVERILRNETETETDSEIVETVPITQNNGECPSFFPDWGANQ
jgi:hypothetical protein